MTGACRFIGVGPTGLVIDKQLTCFPSYLRPLPVFRTALQGAQAVEILVTSALHKAPFSLDWTLLVIVQRPASNWRLFTLISDTMFDCQEHTGDKGNLHSTKPLNSATHKPKLTVSSGTDV